LNRKPHQQPYGNIVPQKTPATIYRHDYQTPAYLVDRIDLDFALSDNATRVHSTLHLRLNPDRAGKREPLVLDGERLELVDIRLDGCSLSTGEYLADAEQLRIDPVPESFVLEIETQIDPQHNTALEGLYLSNGNFCTQCEAEGFRRITYYPDRPDVLACFRVRIEAATAYPVLLSNGNLVDQGRLDNGRHYAVWEDPFPKPSYLFALVAGDLVALEGHYRTQSGRDVLLQIYVEKRNRDYCDHAMASLKKAMRWDEEVYGVEYDLARYMIVAVDDFNMGAMENKGLNIFNSKYVLAHPETATDNDYLGVEGVIGHEYFHNWTGNRVTCRDWFQLSLKEGLTVFRDQEFSAAMNSAAVQRIDDVKILRQFQFPEDAGPMAHPVRPESYVEINNFYTTTVYNKGAEIIRMLQTLLGRDRFIAGVRHYLQRHDGQAASCDDFIGALEDACQVDLSQFKRWYSQAGTPEVTLEQDYDSATQRLTLTCRQHCEATPGQTEKQPFQIPLALGLLDAEGRDLPLKPVEREEQVGPGGVLNVTEAVEVFTFAGIQERPILSPLRGFSAPVKIHCSFADNQLALRMAGDSDPFNRWEAGQTLATKELLRTYRGDGNAGLQEVFVAAWGQALADERADKSLLAQLLMLPSEQCLADQLEFFDPQRLREVRNRAQRQLAGVYNEQLRKRYRQCRAEQGEYAITPAAIGGRSLQNFCLTQLARLGDQAGLELCLGQYREAANMTDRLVAFAALVDSDADARPQVLEDFYRQWHEHPLLLDKWFSVQALAQREATLEEVERLLGHADFSLSNPNRVRALLGALSQNLAVFHCPDGRAYRLLVDQIVKLDSSNPQLAAWLATPLTRWRRLEPARRGLLRGELELLRATELSRDLYEIVSKSLVPCNL
jgi:aminopeptidase N